MKTFLARSVALLPALLAFVILRSQESTEDFQFKISVNHISRLHYYGRTDSLQSSGTFSMAELWFNEKFYVTAAPVFVHNQASSMKYAGTVATIGYQFGKAPRWSGNFYIMKPFYESESSLVQSALKAQTGALVSFLNNYVNISLGGDLKFSDKIDAGLSAAIDHLWRKEFKGSSVLLVDPTAIVNAGTQHFTNKWQRKSEFVLFPGFEETVVEHVRQFNLLSYEFSIPVIWAMGNWQLSATPAYVIPQNLLKVETQPEFSEKGKQMFYLIIGAKLTL